ncbi:phosphoribosylglycinamide formyltransferase [Virgibacillus sp. MG-45]|uniref:phosphoribosylglycinamide formyltransferase n=1 Tax=Virgibacillus sp. MG-45 TaxID=3102791 RepID=UPI002ED9AD2B
MVKQPKAAVFASGTGSNFQALMESTLACDICMLVCDRAEAEVVQKARHFQLRTIQFDPTRFLSKQDYEQMLVEKLHEEKIEWIFLAGYMRIIGHILLEAYEGKIINIHPSLLPAFPGKDAIRQAWDRKVRTTGVTIHFVDEGIDTGAIIAQESVAISPEDTLDLLTQKIHQVEHRLYPKTINLLLHSCTNK